MFRSMILASYLFAAGLVGACSDTTAYADQVAAPGTQPQIAIGVSPAKVRAPYDVQIIRENGETLPTYALKDRYYVQGNSGERYTIRITNPTPRRVEAVVSVDGLDVVDGDGGDLRKRGYVVPAYGETRIEGFRTSTADVATFRFSSVDGSYAGKKGVARNVGVIAVALFEEAARPEEQQQVIVGDDDSVRRRPSSGKYDYTDDLDRGASHNGAPTTTSRPAAKDDDGRVARAEKKEAPPAAHRVRPSADKAKAPAPADVSSRSPVPPPTTAPTGGAVSRGNYDDEAGEDAPMQRPTERPGLGTEFGEQRYSAANYTRFVRAPGRPIAIAELRYNDGAGLEALGINVRPRPDAGEIMTRETADPFPGDPNHFSRAP
jgi:hypothetical protein